MISSSELSSSSFIFVVKWELALLKILTPVFIQKGPSNISTEKIKLQ